MALLEKKEQEPKYIPSVLNTPMPNYSTYVMDWKEKMLFFLIAFIAGGAVGLVFYGGQFKDVQGTATTATWICNVIIFVVVGFIAAKVFYPIRLKQLKEKRQMELTRQFRGFLDALTVSLSSGMNLSDSLSSAYKDLKVEYSEKADIVFEVEEMILGIQNNVPIENVIAFFGERSRIDDIKNFAIVFSVSYRAGGNLKDIIRRTNNIIGEKIEIREEIETTLTSNKSQFTAMMCIPVVIMLLLRTMSSAFAASFATVPGVIAITVAIGIFIASYMLGQKIMDIKG
uniref:type II secretion system F family protein n=1 Tax=Agathobacter sp. TaxID=2021311 RepID=UPI0040569EDD